MEKTPPQPHTTSVFCWSSLKPAVAQLGLVLLCTSEAALEAGYGFGEAGLEEGVVVLNAEQSEQRTQWVALHWGTQMCDCVALKPCQDLLCQVTTLTESVFLHVRTNAGLPDPNRERDSEGEGILRRARGRPRLIGEIASVARCMGTQ